MGGVSTRARRIPWTLPLTARRRFAGNVGALQAVSAQRGLVRTKVMAGRAPQLAAPDAFLFDPGCFFSFPQLAGGWKGVGAVPDGPALRQFDGNLA